MSRSYDVSGTHYPSVTTILDILGKGDALIHWGVKCAMEYIRAHRKDHADLESLLAAAAANWKEAKEGAADIGSEIHGAIESYIKTGTTLTHSRQEVMNGFNAFLAWEKEHGIKWLHSELTVVSSVHGFAGTLDAICVFERKPYVIDFKSSNGFYDTFPMQIAAYRLAAVEMGHAIEGCGILRLDKQTGLPEWRDYSHTYEQKCKAFLKLTEYYYLAAKRRLPNNNHAIRAHQNQGG